MSVVDRVSFIIKTRALVGKLCFRTKQNNKNNNDIINNTVLANFRVKIHYGFQFFALKMRSGSNMNNINTKQLENLLHSNANCCEQTRVWFFNINILRKTEIFMWVDKLCICNVQFKSKQELWNFMNDSVRKCIFKCFIILIRHPVNSIIYF